MKKFLMMILCLGTCFTVAACSLNLDSSSNMSESSGFVDNSSESPNESTDDGSYDSSDDSGVTEDSTGGSSDDSTDDSIGDDSTGDDSTEEDSSVIAPPIIGGENEMPLVPIG